MSSSVKINPIVVNALAFQLVRSFDSHPLPSDIQVTPDLIQAAKRGGLAKVDVELEAHLSEAKVLAAKLQAKEPIDLGAFEINANKRKRIHLPEGIELPDGFHVKVENDDSTLYLTRGTVSPGENSKTLGVRLSLNSDDKKDVVVHELIFVSTADGGIVPAKIEIKFNNVQLDKTASPAVHVDVARNEQGDDGTPDSGNKTTPLIIGLGGAVVALLGYILSEQKAKTTIAGIGALSLVGTAASIAKRMGTEGDKAVGWMQGKGSWIMGVGGAVLSGIPYYLTEDKMKGSLMPIGLGLIGGVLAWFMEPVRSIFGVPTKPAAQEDSHSH